MEKILFDSTGPRVILPPDSEELEPHNGDIFHLGELLEQKDFPFSKGDFPPIKTTEWNAEKTLEIGRIALAAIDDGEPQPITQRHMSRLAVMGLLPYGTVHEKYFDNFSEYKEAVGSPIRYDRVRYASWSYEDFVEYAKRTHDELGRLPKTPDYIDKFKQGAGPSLRLIQTRGGGVHHLHDSLGYPVIRDWTADDYLEWGVKVINANPDKEPSLFLVGALSQTDRGPSFKNIYDNYPGGWVKFKVDIQEQAARQRQTDDAIYQKNLELYRQLELQGKLSDQEKELTEPELISIGAKYALLDAIGGNLNDGQKRRISRASPTRFISLLRELRPGISAGYIEMVAVSENLFNDIWPEDDESGDLYIPQEKIDQLRSEQAIKQRRFKMQKRKTI